jgi:hypothetical protein
MDLFLSRCLFNSASLLSRKVGILQNFYDGTKESTFTSLAYLGEALDPMEKNPFIKSQDWHTSGNGDILGHIHGLPAVIS